MLQMNGKGQGTERHKEKYIVFLAVCKASASCCCSSAHVDAPSVHCCSAAHLNPYCLEITKELTKKNAASLLNSQDIMYSNIYLYVVMLSIQGFLFYIKIAIFYIGLHLNAHYTIIGTYNFRQNIYAYNLRQKIITVFAHKIALDIVDGRVFLQTKCLVP